MCRGFLNADPTVQRALNMQAVRGLSELQFRSAAPRYFSPSRRVALRDLLGSAPRLSSIEKKGGIYTGGMIHNALTEIKLQTHRKAAPARITYSDDVNMKVRTR